MSARHVLLARGSAGIIRSGLQFVGRSTLVETTSTTHTLTEPAGVASGDLLIAAIAIRAATTTQTTIPSGWTRGPQMFNDNMLAGPNALPSCQVACIKRGASAPALTFTHAAAPNTAIGRVFAYRSVMADTVLNGTASANSALSTTSPAWTMSWTSNIGPGATHLLFAVVCGGQFNSWTNFSCSGYTGASSGTSSADTGNVSSNTWLERTDDYTVNGAGTSLAVFDAYRAGNGTNSNPTATNNLAAGNTCCALSWPLTANPNI